MICLRLVWSFYSDLIADDCSLNFVVVVGGGGDDGVVVEKIMTS